MRLRCHRLLVVVAYVYLLCVLCKYNYIHTLHEGLGMIELQTRSFGRDFLVYCSVGFNIGIVIGLFLYVF